MFIGAGIGVIGGKLLGSGALGQSVIKLKIYDVNKHC